jgi:hypothetical protein
MHPILVRQSEGALPKGIARQALRKRGRLTALTMTLGEEPIDGGQADLAQDAGGAFEIFISDFKLMGIELLEEEFAPTDQIAGRRFDGFFGGSGRQSK